MRIIQWYRPVGPVSPTTIQWDDLDGAVGPPCIEWNWWAREIALGLLNMGRFAAQAPLFARGPRRSPAYLFKFFMELCHYSIVAFSTAVSLRVYMYVYGCNDHLPKLLHTCRVIHA